MRASNLPTLVFFLVALFSFTGVYAETTTRTTIWVEHLPELRGLGEYLAKVVIGSMTSLALIIWLLLKYIWKKDRKEQKAQFDILHEGQAALLRNQTALRTAVIHVHEDSANRLDHLIGIMGECRGCSDAAQTYGQKQERRTVMDSENEHWSAKDSIPQMDKL